MQISSHSQNVSQVWNSDIWLRGKTITQYERWAGCSAIPN